MEDQERHFERLIPMRSALGREFLALQSERNKQRMKFESATDKLAYDTIPYRRSEIALGRFLDDMIPLVSKHLEKMKTAQVGMDRAEEDAKYPLFGLGIRIDRRSEQIIWTRFAIERYRAVIAPDYRKKYKMYHPALWSDLRSAWREFRKQIKRWQFGGQPFDGSQAMHSMIAFQLKARLIASCDD